MYLRSCSCWQSVNQTKGLKIQEPVMKWDQYYVLGCMYFERGQVEDAEYFSAGVRTWAWGITATSIIAQSAFLPSLPSSWFLSKGISTVNILRSRVNPNIESKRWGGVNLGSLVSYPSDIQPNPDPAADCISTIQIKRNICLWCRWAYFVSHTSVMG